MPESSVNVELAHQLHENSEKLRHSRRRNDQFEERLEIFEAFLLAIVAVATAWSGYQSARWDGRSADSYAQSSTFRTDGDNAATLGGQERQHDISTFNTWLQAKLGGNEKMAELLERRFTDDYQPSFKAWLSTDPFNNPEAPPGPTLMPEYVNHLEKKGLELRRQANEAFESGRLSREIAEDYVRLTVFLATVLFLVAISQRFKNHWTRLGLLSTAALATLITLILLISYPRS